MQLIILGLMIPFIGTIGGSSLVFFIKNDMNEKIKKILLGFAGGVMLATSFWSLLIPSFNLAKEKEMIPFLPVSLGLALGFIFIFNDIIYPKISKKRNKTSKTKLLLLTVTLHNIPEGMVIGIVFAGVLFNNTSLTLMMAFSLSLGIAIQNFPEGTIVSIPFKIEGYSKIKSFMYGVLSGIVEPLFGILTILLSSLVSSILPYLLSFAAGAMIYVVIKELVPEFEEGKYSSLATLSFAFGLILMTILDCALS